jgi:hypothetical protein
MYSYNLLLRMSSQDSDALVSDVPSLRNNYLDSFQTATVIQRIGCTHGMAASCLQIKIGFYFKVPFFLVQ